MNLGEKLTIEILGKVDSSFEDSFRKIKGSISSLDTEMASVAGVMAVGMGGILVGLTAIIGKWLEAAGSIEQYKQQLVTLLKDVNLAEETISNTVELAKNSPFDVKGLVDATVKLESYGARSQEILPLVGDLAAGMGKRVEDTALVMGKAWSGSLEGLESLRNEYGISTAKLIQYGAETNKAGGVMTQTKDQIEKVRHALTEIIKTEYGGAMERQSKTWQGAVSNLGDAINKLAAAMGDQLLPAATGIVKVFTGFVDIFSGIPESWRQLAAYGTVLAAGLTAVAGAGLTLVSSGIQIYLGLEAIRLKFAELTGSAAGSAGVINLNSGSLLGLQAETESATVSMGKFTVAMGSSSAATDKATASNVAYLGSAELISAKNAGITASSVPAATGMNAVTTATTGTGAAATATAISLGSVLSVLGYLAAGYAAVTVAVKLMEGAWDINNQLIENGKKSGGEWWATWGQALSEVNQWWNEHTNIIGFAVAQTKKEEEASKNLEKEIVKQEVYLREARGYWHSFGTKSAEDLKALGVSSDDLKGKIKVFSEAAQYHFGRGEVAQGKFYMNGIKNAQDQIKALEELEKKLKAIDSALSVIESDYKNLKAAEIFDNSTQEVEYLRKKIVDTQDTLEQFGINLSGMKFDANFDFNDIDTAKVKLNLLMDAEAEYKRQSEDKDLPAGEQMIAKQRAQYLQVLIDLVSSAVKAEKAVRKDEISDLEDKIDRKKTLYGMDLQEEKAYWDKYIKTTKAGSDERKAAEEKIYALKKQIRDQDREESIQSLEDELSALKNKTGVELKEYDKLISKIKEYIKEKRGDKETVKEGTKVLKETEEAKKDESEKREKDKYDRLVDIQKKSLDEMDKNEELSYDQKIKRIQDQIAYWKRMEAARVITSKQAIDQISDLESKLIDLRSSLQQANKTAEEDILSLKKSALEDEISQITEKWQAGEDVENKLIEKIKEKRNMELSYIEKARQEMEKQGINRELIEEKVRLLKLEAYNNEKEQLDELKQKVQDVKKEAEPENKKAVYTVQEMADYFSNLFKPKEKQTETKLKTQEIEAEAGGVTEEINKLRRTGVSAVKTAGNTTQVETGLKSVQIGTININLNGGSGSSGSASSAAVAGAGAGGGGSANVTAKMGIEGLTFTIPQRIWDVYKPDVPATGRENE